ncbi:MAG: glycosyltransferase family 2 protein [Bdellovibrionota bacterium]
MSSINKNLSFFLPFYNEEKTLGKTVTLLLMLARTHLNQFEVLLINDGSTDSSSQIAELLVQQHAEVQLINLKTNQGFGAAYISGILHAKFQHAMYLSTDGDVHEDELKHIFAAWDGEKNLLQFANNPQERHLSRYILSRLFTIATNLLSGSRWPYYNGYNIYTLENRKNLKNYNFSFASQAYAVLTLIKDPKETILLTTRSRFNDTDSKSITLSNLQKTFSFFIFLLRQRVLSK